ncbi:hypothetical protein K501DRAFT_286869 [Backusella circina FSU 941]|nr:hypothetical protein K501DRAFT_286869 [Backusella circina FSU 941]
MVEDTVTLTDSSYVPSLKQSVHSFRVLDSNTDETESDKDLIIHSLHESLYIHKEILQRIQSEKDAFQQTVQEERMKEKGEMEHYREMTSNVMEEQDIRCHHLENSIAELRRELDMKKEEHRKLEVKFYSYVKSIRVTDDDLSTIQPEISHLLSQLNNTCMGLKSKMNKQGGSDFVFKFWSGKEDLIKEYMMPAGSEAEALLDVSFVTLFVEKYLIDTMLEHIIDIPIHMGVSINDAFKEVQEWMSDRNDEWTTRLRQQICSLVIQKPGDEETNIEEAKDRLLEHIINDLHVIYPSLKEDANQRKKIENLITRASKLSLAMKGQDIKIKRLAIKEGVDFYDSTTMKTTAKGKPNGLVFLQITPPFVAQDEIDSDHGFVVPGKVFCIVPPPLPTDGE